MPDDKWRDVIAAIGELPRLIDDAPDHERAEGVRYLLRFVSAGIRICVEHDDAAAPMLTRSIEHRMAWGLDNPDTTYLFTRVEPGVTYRLRGSKGSARRFESQVNAGHQGDGDFAGWQATWWVTGDDLPDELDLEIPPTDEASFLFIRQYFSDWETEVPATLDVQRLDVDLPVAPLDDAALDARLALLAQWLRTGADCWRDFSNGIMGGVASDATEWQIQPFIPPDTASGLKGQGYGMGGWRCEPDEAVIVTVDPPPAVYWSVSLCDRFWQSIDFAQRQSSLNDSQVTPDGDGRFTMVICHDDPGVANWLDPANRTAGSAAVRYLDPEGGNLPPVTLRRVPRASLADELPAGLPTVSAPQRQDVLRRRQAAIARRLRW